MLYFAYLDEFGHIGPYVSRNDPYHKDSPVFGLAGIVLPYPEVRGFATWFYQLKCRLLGFEILKSQMHPAKWEKKGSALYTIKNIATYRELTYATNRIMNKLQRCGGFIYYYGIEKTVASERHSSRALYCHLINESIKRLNEYCEIRNSNVFIILDQMDDELRRNGVERAGKTMFGSDNCKRLIEPPVQVESHLYQTLQCADWLCGLFGRLFAYDARPAEYPENLLVKKLFEERIKRVVKNSTIKKRPISNPSLGLALEKARAQGQADKC